MKQERDQLPAQLTPRELDILHLLAEGLVTTSMSVRLGIARHTVERHVRNVIETAPDPLQATSRHLGRAPGPDRALDLPKPSP